MSQAATPAGLEELEAEPSHIEPTMGRPPKSSPCLMQAAGHVSAATGSVGATWPVQAGGM